MCSDWPIGADARIEIGRAALDEKYDRVRIARRRPACHDRQRKEQQAGMQVPTHTSPARESQAVSRR